MNFHQKTNNRHRSQLMSTENYRTKKRQRILVLIMLMMLGLSTIARPKVKSKYNSLYIPEVVVDSTLHKVLLQKAIPALEITDQSPFSWMVFSTKSFWAWNELDNLVGSVWAIREGKYDNQGLGFMPKGFCIIGNKTVFFNKNAAQYIKKKANGKVIVVKFNRDWTKLYWGDYDPIEIRIFKRQSDYTIMRMKVGGEWEECNINNNVND